LLITGNSSQRRRTSGRDEVPSRTEAVHWTSVPVRGAFVTADPAGSLGGLERQLDHEYLQLTAMVELALDPPRASADQVG
jgi:hypothetical protein